VRGEAPVGLLAAAELAELDTFKVRKRRKDWLLGRWTAKHLVQAHLTETTGHPLPLDQLTIKHEADGAPYVTLHDVTPERTLPVSLSISHINGYAFCALYDAQLDENLEPNARAAASKSINIGADIEHIEPRERSFITDFFTSSEIAAIEQMPASQQAALVTAIWSAKEAVVKALVDELLRELTTRAAEELGQSKSVADGFERGTAVLVDVMSERRELVRVALTEASHPAVTKSVSELHASLATLLAEQIRALDAKVDADSIAWALVGAIHLQIVRWAVYETLETKDLAPTILAVVAPFLAVLVPSRRKKQGAA